MNLVLGLVEAELAANPSIVLDTDLLDGAFQTAFGLFGLGQGLGTFKGASPSAFT